MYERRLMPTKTKYLLVCRILFAAFAAVPGGFLLYAVAYGEEATAFSYWFFHPIWNPLEWGAYGSVMGILWHLIVELGKISN